MSDVPHELKYENGWDDKWHGLKKNVLKARHFFLKMVTAAPPLKFLLDSTIKVNK